MDLGGGQQESIVIGDEIDLYRLFLRMGLPTNTPVKLYRHNLDKIDGLSPAEIEIFQAVQTKNNLGDGLVAFFAQEDGEVSSFVGMRTVVKPFAYDEASGADFVEAKSKGYIKPGELWHTLARVEGYDALVGRLLIRWPPHRTAHRWLLDPNKDVPAHLPVHAIRARGFNRLFPGFNRVILSFAELRTLIRDGDGGTGWRAALTSTRGVYLITDLEMGYLYVGSATGDKSFWGRWEIYAKTGHGNNKIMIEKFEEARQGGRDFSARLQFSILETMNGMASRKDGTSAERRWKEKLGEKATILNDN